MFSAQDIDCFPRSNSEMNGISMLMSSCFSFNHNIAGYKSEKVTNVYIIVVPLIFLAKCLRDVYCIWETFRSVSVGVITITASVLDLLTSCVCGGKVCYQKLYQ